MNKKVLITVVLLSLLLLVGGCPIPVDVAICGNNICESGEDDICPSDCDGTDSMETTTSLSCDATCAGGDLCQGYFGEGDVTCCIGSCMNAVTDITFSSGWNFVSFPFVELNDPIRDIFANLHDVPGGSGMFLDNVDSIYSYQGEWLVWHSDSSIPSNLDYIEAGRAYVVIMDSGFVVSLADLRANLDGLIAAEGTSRSPHEIDVWAGWNLVASSYGEDDEMRDKPLQDYFETVEGSYASIWHTSSSGSLDKLSITNSENLLPTNAYWLYMDSDGEIIP
jgi:hypothetical protein